MIPEFATKDDLFKWLSANKSLLIAQKKSALKLADAVTSPLFFLLDRSEKTQWKAEIIPTDSNAMEVVATINTTNIFDSHGDVHIPGLWNKSLSVNKAKYLVKQHDFSFDGIISDEVKATAPIMQWKDLGFNYSGSTQALTYTATISKEDPTGMFGRYAAGKVKQHSVGMQYVKLALAIDQKKYADEKAVWDKYFNEIANKEDAEEAGYFWAVTEAKDIEGSAVVRGSNFATPTQSVSAKQVESISREQVKSIPKIDMSEALSKFKLKF